jgi:hypothetical protein
MTVFTIETLNALGARLLDHSEELAAAAKERMLWRSGLLIGPLQSAPR